MSLDKTMMLGFGFRARSGKDTIANHILEQRGARFDIRRYGFADELKREVQEALAEMVPFVPLNAPAIKYKPREAFDALTKRLSIPAWVAYDEHPDYSDPLCPPPFGKQRSLLQWWGTEYRRAQNPRYWVDALARRISADEPSIALITDCRFKNELGWIRGHGGYMICVKRYDVPQGERLDPDKHPEYLLAGSMGSHASETELEHEPFDLEIDCASGSVELLKTMSLALFDFIMLPFYVTRGASVDRWMRMLSAAFKDAEVSVRSAAGAPDMGKPATDKVQ